MDNLSFLTGLLWCVEHEIEISDQSDFDSDLEDTKGEINVSTKDPRPTDENPSPDGNDDRRRIKANRVRCYSQVYAADPEPGMNSKLQQNLKSV